MAHIQTADVELAAFVEGARRDRPVAWATVERLQRACRTHPPLTPEGSALAIDVLCSVHGEPAAPDSGAFGLPVQDSPAALAAPMALP